MKRIGTSLLAVFFLLQACDTDPKNEDGNNDPDKPVIEPKQPPLINPDPKDPTKNNEDPKAPLSRTAVHHFYRALHTVSNGQDDLKGRCGNIGGHSKPGDKKSITVQLPFKDCEVAQMVINGTLNLHGRKQYESASIKGKLNFAGSLTGECDVALQYPSEKVFQAALIPEESADLGLVEIEHLSGTLCGVDITEVVKEVAAADAAEAAKRAEAEKADADKAGADEADADKAGADKAGADKAGADKAEAAKADAAKGATVEALQEKVEASKAAVEKARAEAIATNVASKKMLADANAAVDLAKEAAEEKSAAVAKLEEARAVREAARTARDAAKTAAKAKASGSSAAK